MSTTSPFPDVSTTHTTPTHPPGMTVAEAVAESRFSRQTITRMFARAKGVHVICRPETMGKRGYRSIRIPRHVYDRVMLSITN